MLELNFYNAEQLLLGKESYVYNFYSGKILSLTSPNCSPLRQDKHPSFTLFPDLKFGTNKLLWKDHATGQRGNIFQFVALMRNISTTDALLLINNDFKLNLGTENPSLFLSPSIKIQPKELSLNFSRGIFNDFDINYWNSYGLSLEFISKFNVMKAQTVEINGNSFESFYNNPIYAYVDYCEPTNPKIQIYRPFAEAYKFVSNMNDFNVHGFDLLPRSGEKLIITKSRKDMLVLASYGFPAISSCRENTMIPHNIIEVLKVRFKEIYLLFDPDKTGYVTAKKYVDYYEFKAKFVITDRCLLNNKGSSTKDISDFRRMRGYEATKEKLIEMFYGR